MFNKSLVVVGLILAAVGGLAAFVLNEAVNPPAVVVVAARENLEPNTPLSDIGDDLLVMTTVRGDSNFLQSMLTDTEWADMRDAGAVLIAPVNKYEPVLKSEIAASNNDAASRMSSLALSSPDLMIVQISGTSSPLGIKTNDLVDLAVAVSNLNSNQSQSYLPPQAEKPNGLVSTVELPLIGPTATPLPSATPTQTPTPALQAPVAKVIVHAARVVRVNRDYGQPVNSSTGSAVTEKGILSIELVIPRAAFEFIVMGDAAGKLSVGILSPLASTDQAPSMGASLDDLLSLFNADRMLSRQLLLTPSTTPTKRPTATSTPNS